MKKILVSMLGVLLLVGAFIVLKMKSGEGLKGEGAETNGTPRVTRETSSRPNDIDGDTMSAKTDRPKVSARSVTVLGGKDNDAAGRKMLSKINDSMTKMNEGKVAKLIAKLVKDLNLSPEQEKELEEYFAEQIKLAGGMFSGEFDGDDPMAGAKAMAAIEGKGLDDVMADLLTPEQAEIWKERAQKQAHRTADSAALKELASLNSVIEVREDQREAVYDHFYQKKLAAENDGSTNGLMSSAISSFTKGLGIEMDTSAFAGAGLQEAMETATAEGEEVDVAALMREQREKQIEAEMAELAPILDEGQLTDYREHLESNGSFMESFMGGQSHDTMIVIPSVPEGE